MIRLQIQAVWKWPRRIVTRRTLTSNSDSKSAGEAERDTSREKPKEEPDMPKEVDGPKGQEPTTFGDWQRKGRTSDF